MHLTETCDAEPHLPHVIIVDVQTTSATTADDVMLGPVQASLAARERLPAEQFADKGYVNAGSLLSSQARGVDLVGEVAVSSGWQARQATGFDKSRFVIDWERQVMTCLAGQQSAGWRPVRLAGRPEVWAVRFSPHDCGPCLHRAQCTHSPAQPREFRLPPQRRSTKRWHNGRNNRPRRFSSAAGCGRVARRRKSKRSGAPVCGRRAMSGWPKRTCSMC